MKRFFTPLERHPAETRASLAPATVVKLRNLGLDVLVQSGAGLKSDFSDADYESSPIYGMPIINAHKAKTTFCLKRGKGAGFSGLENTLFTAPNTRMLYGDAKATVTGLVAQFKD